MYWAGAGKSDLQERQGNSGLACVVEQLSTLKSFKLGFLQVVTDWFYFRFCMPDLGFGCGSSKTHTVGTELGGSVVWSYKMLYKH